MKLMKDIQKYKCKDVLCSWIGRFNIVKISILHLSHKIKTIPNKIPVSYFMDIDTLIPMFMETQKIQNIHLGIKGDEQSGESYHYST